MGMEKKATINDIARISNVSRTTISRYLNGKFENMSKETQERIRQVIEDLNYHPSRQARFLKTQKTGILGIIVGDISNFYTARLIKGMMNRLKKSQYHPIIMDSDLSRTLEQRNINKLLEEQVEGVIIQPLGIDSSDYKMIDHQFPLVQIDRYVEPLVWPAVVSDNFKKSKELVQLVIEKNYKRLIVLSPPVTFSSTRIKRYEGLMDAIKTQEIELKEFIAPEAKDLDVDNSQFWNEILPLTQDHVKTAIYTFNGPLLFECIKFLKQNKLEIPKDIGLVGYDDLSWGEIMGPGITAVEQNLEKIGYVAVDTLIKEIEEKKITKELIMIPSKLIPRQSL